MTDRISKIELGSLEADTLKSCKIHIICYLNANKRVVYVLNIGLKKLQKSLFIILSSFFYQIIICYKMFFQKQNAGLTESFHSV